MSQDFAQHLRQAAPFIHAHQGRTCVAYLPGEAALREDFAAHLFDLALAHGLGLRLVLVLGARPQIQQRLEQAGIPERLHHNNLRITDAATLDCVRQACGALRHEVEALLSTALARTPLGGRRVEVVSGNLVTARPTGIVDGVDMQHTGELRRIAADSIRTHLSQGRIVLLSCIGTSPTGESFNLRSEELAVAAAASLQADKLLLLSPREIPAGECTPAALDEYADIPEAERSLARRACDAGIGRVHLLPLDRPGVVLGDLYTQAGGGLLVSAQVSDTIRPATIDDIAGLLGLIAPLEQQGQNGFAIVGRSWCAHRMHTLNTRCHRNDAIDRQRVDSDRSSSGRQHTVADGKRRNVSLGQVEAAADSPADLGCGKETKRFRNCPPAACQTPHPNPVPKAWK